MDEHDLFQIASKALVFDKDGKLLLMKDGIGEWDLPGGRMHYEETFEQAIRRECREELGVECSKIETTPSFAWTAQNGIDKDNAWRVDICFRVELESNSFKPSDENVEHGYFT
jgi:8-oxo-dGTP pyrophosphatase MutT (NUDIX family)